MKFIGFSIHKISAEKLSEEFKNLKIETNIKIEGIVSTKSEIFKKDEEILKISFSYTLDYNPKIAKLIFSGEIILLAEEKEAKIILEQWEDKKVPEETKIQLFNFILRKTNLKALDMEDELNLPLHISFPSLKMERK